MNKLYELLFINSLKGVGKKTIHKKYLDVVRRCQNIDELTTMYIPRIKAFSAAEIESAFENAKIQIDSIQNTPNVQAVTILEDKYPVSLRALGDAAPVILYIKGNPSVLSENNIAIVGTRKPSIVSTKIEFNLVSKIIELSNRTIVSGLAIGCDTIAHETALKIEGKTFAVLPSGVNNIVPSQNRDLAERIIEQDGCLVSEYPIQAEAYRGTFIERDSLIAALSDITVVVECGVKSGTMHTVSAAKKLNKPIACVRPEDRFKGDYSGNEYMIREMGAVSLADEKDLISLFAAQ